MATDNLSTARKLAEAFGCSLPTVMLKAKKLGIKFKGRTTAEHDTLVAALEALRPRARMARAVPLTESQVLYQNIVDHLDQKSSLIKKIKDRIAQIDRERDVLNSEKANLLAQIRDLDPAAVPSVPDNNLNP